MDGEETMSSSKAAAPATIRLVNFVSEEQLDEAKRSRGERVEDGTAQRDKPLFQILLENKDKKDAEFNERFKHRPPKALDEDESEFLDKLALGLCQHGRLSSLQLLEACFCRRCSDWGEAMLSSTHLFSGVGDARRVAAPRSGCRRCGRRKAFSCSSSSLLVHGDLQNLLVCSSPNPTSNGRPLPKSAAAVVLVGIEASGEVPAAVFVNGKLGFRLDGGEREGQDCNLPSFSKVLSTSARDPYVITYSMGFSVIFMYTLWMI